MPIFKRSISLVLIVMLMMAKSYAQKPYPENKIKAIVHVSPGGGTDNMARLVLRYAGKKLGVNFVIENHTGAGGQIGYSVLARSKPDGYTLGTITTMSIITHELTRKNVAYRFQEDFIPIARVVMDPSALFVLVTDSIKTFGQLVEIAKNGKINCAGTAFWGSDYVHLKRVEMQTGVGFTYIPFDGVSEVRNILLGEHVRVASGGLSNFQSLIKAGKVRPLVVASEERHPMFPQVPTYKELGYSLVTGSSRGFAFSKDTPQSYVVLLSNTILEVLKNPAFLAEAKKMGFKEFIAPLNSIEFAEMLVELSGVMTTLTNENEK